ncbi:seipin-2-like [Rhododendron vialii]|uniref:seipin-2-like n=1 Tax=Rhododendron vialii TaxID=182163 RepID=UPI00265EEBC0|nr:seipin-2-like [Rhododendron vialii]
MDDSKNHQTIPFIPGDHRLIRNSSEFLGFDRENYVNSRKFLIKTVKNVLLFGADKVLMARKSKSFRNIVFVDNDGDDNIDKFLHNEEFVDASKVVSKGYNQAPLNLMSFFAILVLRSIGFQINLFTAFLTLPIRLSYTTITFFLFPFQTLEKIRADLTKRVLKLWADFYLSIASYILSRLKAQKRVLNLAIRLGWAFFCSVYVFFVLFGLLVTGFLLGGFAMSRLVEKPMEMTEAINFDYTKESPAAFVPIVSYPGPAVSSGLISRESVESVESVESAKVVRAIPYNHKLRLTLSLTLPESEYNRKLGVFQVRVEFLSASGRATASSTHPCMLRFKSHPIHLLETAFKAAPLMTGFQSESQTLDIKISDFTEGHEPTACLKVVLEQRAGYQSGAGIPQLYTASIALESELPQLKKIVWCWRRTVFVWISVMMYLTEVVVVLVLFRAVVMARGKREAKGCGGAKRDSSASHGNRISW